MQNYPHLTQKKLLNKEKKSNISQSNIKKSAHYRKKYKYSTPPQTHTKNQLINWEKDFSLPCAVHHVAPEPHWVNTDSLHFPASRQSSWVTLASCKWPVARRSFFSTSTPNQISNLCLPTWFAWGQITIIPPSDFRCVDGPSSPSRLGGQL